MKQVNCDLIRGERLFPFTLYGVNIETFRSHEIAHRTKLIDNMKSLTIL